MTTSTFLFRFTPVVVGLLVALCPLHLLAQHQLLPVTSSYQTKSQSRNQAAPVHRQQVSTAHRALTKTEGNLIKPDFPVYTQQVTGTAKPLAYSGGEVQQKKIVKPQSVTLSGTALSVAPRANTIKKLTAITTDGPVGTPDNYAVPSDKTLSIAAPGFLSNDIDLNGEALTATAITNNVDHGTLAAFADGSFTYTPNTGFTGIDSFAYTMRDASNNASGPVTVTIQVLTASNRIPVGSPDVYGAVSGTTLSIASPGFLSNDIDPDGEAITATAITNNVDHGTLAAFADGSFTYTPDAGFTGTDSFAYTMRDASNHSSGSVSVAINVVEGNRPPIGVNDEYTAVINTPLSIAAAGFLTNDVDPDGDAITATAITNNVDHGTLAAFADGSFTYTPNTGFTGIDSFSYSLRDALNHSSGPVTVTINVVSPNRPPVADAGIDKTVDCDGSGGATVILDGSGSSDPDNNTLTFTWRENGSIIAGPTTDAQTKVFLALGLHTIELTVNDGAGDSTTDEVKITVADVTPPIVTAAFVPKPRDNKIFTVQFLASDACDQNLRTTSVIELPTVSNPVMQFQVKNSQKIIIDLKANKVIVQGPDPQALWIQVLAAGGIAVINGQSLSLTYNKDAYSFIFGKDGKLKSVQGPVIVLRCTATDGSGNTTVVEATAPINHNRAKVMSEDVTDDPLASDHLDQNYPNPFKYNTVIGYTLAQAGQVRLTVYDSKGQLVKTLVDGVMPMGQHQVTWDAHNLPAGIYYYRIYTGSFVQIRKMVLLR